MPELILGIITGLIQLANTLAAKLPAADLAHGLEEVQADLDYWRKVLGLYVPNLPPPPTKAPSTP